MKILVINGPNMNLLGLREPDIYGKQTYSDLVAVLQQKAEELGVEISFMQSNHEGDLVDAIQGAWPDTDGIIINPAAYTHTSVAILDAVKAVGIPTVEVHMSDVKSRDEFRQVSYIRQACIATFMGRGFGSYIDALELLVNRQKA
ncbi:MAG: type II 3-dehydroquinate dehydratase [Flexilinea sp.]|nr:type II 3-dehydroquinate dehydratase [Flexilinea sp.]